MTDFVLLTGSAGGVGRRIAPFLLTEVAIRGFDSVPTPALPGLESVVGSILDDDGLDAAMVGVDAVVHLAGIPSEAEWADILRVNIDGTQRVLAAAQRAGVRRVILASSNHAVGFAELPAPGSGQTLASDLAPLPDTFYGVSKAAMEALGHLYHRKHGMDVVSIRIGGASELPQNERSLQNWISPRDLADLVLAALRAPSPVDAVVWGMSANVGSPYDLTSARALGADARDDAAAVAAERGLALPPAAEHDRRYVGGDFTALPLPAALPD